MKYLQTKHERNSAKITTLIMLILTLLLFVVGQDYKEQPEEYGVAINFSSSGDNVKPDQPEVADEQPQKVTEKEEEVEEEKEEIVEEEEIIEEDSIEEQAAAAEAIKEIEDAKKEALEEEKVLREEAEEAAEKLKTEKEAEQKAQTKAAAAEKEAKAAKEKAEAKEAAKAKAAAEAKAKASAEAKQKAQAAAEAKAAADKKAREGTPFALIENAPIYPGCEGGNNETRKQCMSDKIKTFITNNFDTDLASDLTGTQKINISFKIDTKGNVVSISARASDPKLEAEAKRVTGLLPKMKPGMQQGTPVVVAYGLPIKITMED